LARHGTLTSPPTAPATASRCLSLPEQRSRRQAGGRGEPYTALRHTPSSRRTSWAAPSIVSPTRLHAAGNQPHHRYAGTDDGRGTDQTLDAKRLTLMSGWLSGCTVRARHGGGARRHPSQHRG